MDQVILFESNQGERGASYSLGAFQPLLFIRVMETRYYETDDTDYHANCFNQFLLSMKRRNE